MTNILNIDQHISRVAENIARAFGALESKGATISRTEEETPSDVLERAINTLDCVRLVYEPDTGTLRIVTNGS